MTQPQFTLVDMNNFYVACEKNFSPSLKNKPVVVLSNNDGCTVSRSTEAKALGVKMGAPWFQIQDLAREHGIVACSSNFALYSCMSNRVVSILRGMCPDLEVYSVDESFLRVETVAALYGGISEMNCAMRDRILKFTGLGVCCGTGPTKTLAKFSNRLCKKFSLFNGCCDLNELTKSERLHWMSLTDVGEVWGVGPRIAKRLHAMNIHTMLDLRNSAPKKIRGQFGVVMERTVNEIRGISCLELEEVAPARKQIVVSRSFGAPVSSLDELHQSIATYTARAAVKLRAEGSLAAAIQVFISTNPFKQDAPQYGASKAIPLPVPSDDTRALAAAAQFALAAMFRPGFAYKKSGVMLIGLSAKGTRQRTLFEDDAQRARSERLMSTIDRANRDYGRDTITFAAAGLAPRWAMRANNRSPRYTTRWSELPIVR
jgi:DNA polymerase V